MLKQILSKHYPNYFIKGFKIKDVNEDYENLPSVEKVKLMKNVIDALDLDLKVYSSPDKQKRYREVKQRESEVLSRLSKSQAKLKEEEKLAKFRERKRWLEYEKKKPTVDNPYISGDTTLRTNQKAYHKRSHSELLHNRYSDQIF